MGTAFGHRFGKRQPSEGNEQSRFHPDTTIRFERDQSKTVVASASWPRSGRMSCGSWGERGASVISPRNLDRTLEAVEDAPPPPARLGTLPHRDLKRGRLVRGAAELPGTSRATIDRQLCRIGRRPSNVAGEPLDPGQVAQAEFSQVVRVSGRSLVVGARAAASSGEPAGDQAIRRHTSCSPADLNGAVASCRQIALAPAVFALRLRQPRP